ncbi:DUF2975 domain-containing protein [Pedobacter sp. Du54]|uniref:DUF2975 domain-containing protein n=1 Tax=Pedobacter anseongensis TaxID=3133439 RepID=UPI0030A252FE
METNTKRLTLLLRGIDIALFIIAASIIVPFIYATPWVNRFSDMADRFPDSGRFDSLKFSIAWFAYLALIPILISRVIFGIVLYQIRKIVKSILIDGVFHENQANRIRKIAYYFLGFACLMLCFKLIYTIAALLKGNMKVFTSSLIGLVSTFERYILPGLIGLGLAEVFMSGMKIKKDQDLTI